MNIEEKSNLLITEVESVGEIAREYFDSEDLSNEIKDDGTAVTKVDKAIERRIREFVNEYFPDDSVVGEEEDEVEGKSGFVWHIDPIDGTDNFLRKIPFCCISIARLGETTEDSFAIIHNPITKHTFASLMENGTYENKRLTNLTEEMLGGKYVVCSGMARKENWMMPARHKIVAALETEFGKCTSYGSSALELAYLAAGRIDGYFTYGLSTYDYAAVLYLVKAAGGAISVFENGEWVLWEGSMKSLCDKHGKIIFASHPVVHERIRDFIGDPKKWAE